MKTSGPSKPDRVASSDLTVSVDADLTIYTAMVTKDKLLTALANADSLQIDLAKVSEADTAGLQLLLLVNREASKAGKTLRLVAPSSALRSVLELCNVRSSFICVPTLLPVER